jgi:hypothetical protein
MLDRGSDSNVVDIHPSQRRVVCEICKRHKAKCQRIQQNDLKCSRCTMLGVDCEPGQQKKLGRPRRSAPVPGFKIPKATTKAIPGAKLLAGSDERGRVNKEYLRLQSGSENISSNRQHVKHSTCNPISLPLPATTPPSTACESSMYDPASAWLSVSPARSWTPGPHLPITANDVADPMNPYTIARMYSPVSSRNDDITEHHSKSPVMATIAAPTQPGSINWLHHLVSLEYINYSRASGALYFDIENRTITNKAVLVPSTTMDHRRKPDVAHTLLKLSYELELRRLVIEYSKPTLDLDALIYQRGPLFINNFTLGEFLISATQVFLQILT